MYQLSQPAEPPPLLPTPLLPGSVCYTGKPLLIVRLSPPIDITFPQETTPSGKKQNPSKTCNLLPESVMYHPTPGYDTG